MSSEKLKFTKRVYGPGSTNSYLLVHDDYPSECILVDVPPGSFEGWQDVVLSKKLKIHVLLTHAHWDHAADLHLFQKFGAIIYLHENDYTDWLSKEGGKVKMIEKNDNVHFTKDEEILTILGQKIRVSLSPGHSAGSLLFHFEGQFVFVGCTICQFGVGVCDQQYGSKSLLKKSVIEKIFSLPDDLVAYPGHGLKTSIGSERKICSWVHDSDEEDGEDEDQWKKWEMEDAEDDSSDDDEGELLNGKVTLPT